MKKTTLILCLPFLALLACSTSSRSSENGPVMDSISIRDSLDRLRDGTRAEIEEYRTRIRNRIDEMQHDMETTREQWKAEKNAKKQKKYQEDLDRLEKDRSTLQQKLDRMGNNIESEWQEFKRDVDDFFNQDHQPAQKDRS